MLLHLCTVADWSRALADGGVDPLPSVGFVHLSTPDQVHLPARRLFAGRDDVLLLVVDEARLADPVRYEPGVPGDPESMRFPHLYGRLPATAVVGVVPWDPELRVPLPAAADPAGRHAALALSLPLRRALAAGDPVRRRPTGWSVDAVHHPASHDDNRLLLPFPAGVEQVMLDIDPLVPGARPTVTWCWPGAETAAARLATELRARGWDVTEDRVMVRWLDGGTETAGQADVVDQRDVHELWAESWVEVGVDDPGVVAQLVGREQRTAGAVDVVDVGVRRSGRVVAAGQLRVDGATGAVESLLTAPAHRGRGLADDVLDRLVVEAGRAGCDLVVLEADAEDWPQGWYARRGFADVGVTRSATPTAPGG